VEERRDREIKRHMEGRGERKRRWEGREERK